MNEETGISIFLSSMAPPALLAPFLSSTLSDKASLVFHHTISSLGLICCNGDCARVTPLDMLVGISIAQNHRPDSYDITSKVSFTSMVYLRAISFHIRVRHSLQITHVLHLAQNQTSLHTMSPVRLCLRKG